MAIAFNVLLLAVGFVLLIKGADFFVDGSSSIARHIGIPGFVIGLTVVAMGTSAPEAAVSITASAQSSNEIAIPSDAASSAKAGRPSAGTMERTIAATVSQLSSRL